MEPLDKTRVDDDRGEKELVGTPEDEINQNNQNGDK